MDIEERQVGLVGFSREVQLTALQQRMAEGCFGGLTFDWGDYEKQGWSQMALAIRTITAQKLLIWNNQCPAILRELTHVAFPNLARLIARNNRITSVETLVSAQCPQLKELDLSDNLIVSTQSFAKMNLQELETLNISGNPITSCENLFKANFRRVGKIELAEPGSLMEKFRMANDPVMWKVKLQAVLAADGNYYNRHRRPPRGYRHYHTRPKEQSSLEYCNVREMLSMRQPH